MKNRLAGLGPVLLVLAAAPTLAACSSSSGGSCGKVGPCGGDVVGDWTVSGACVNNATLTMQIIPNCPMAMATGSNIKVTGHATFNADLTYNLTETITASGSGTVPPSCLQVISGVTLTCAELDLLIQQLVASDPTMLQSAHCTGNATCTCSFTTAPQTTTGAGNYYNVGAEGSTLEMILSDTGGVATALVTDYCVQKNEMHWVQVNTTMPLGAMGQANIDSDTVWRKN